jgi:hypothetical protein
MKVTSFKFRFFIWVKHGISRLVLLVEVKMCFCSLYVHCLSAFIFVHLIIPPQSSLFQGQRMSECDQCRLPYCVYVLKVMFEFRLLYCVYVLNVMFECISCEFYWQAQLFERIKFMKLYNLHPYRGYEKSLSKT